MWKRMAYGSWSWTMWKAKVCRSDRSVLCGHFDHNKDSFFHLCNHFFAWWASSSGISSARSLRFFGSP